MKYKFKIETEDYEELVPYLEAKKNSAIVFELKNNFFRKFKHLENQKIEFKEGVYYALEQMREFLDNN